MNTRLSNHSAISSFIDERSSTAILPRRILGGILFIITGMIIISLLTYSDQDIMAIQHGSAANNGVGVIGAWISYGIITLIGIGGFIIPGILIVAAYMLVRSAEMYRLVEKVFALLTLILPITITASLMRGASTEGIGHGGMMGKLVTGFLLNLFTQVGTVIIICIICAISLALCLWAFAVLQHYTVMMDSIGSRMGFPFSRRRNDIPETRISKKTTERLPWISKKRILVYHTEVTEHGHAVPLSEPLLPAPAMDTSLDRVPWIDYGKTIDYDQVIIDGRKRIEDDNTREEPVYEISEDSVHTTDDDRETADEIVMVPAYETVTAPEAETPAVNELENEAIHSEIAHNESVYDDETVAEIDTVFQEIPISQEYILPVNYLQSSVPLDSESWNSEIRRNSLLLVNTLADFGIESKVVQVNRGPVISLYEMQIAPGIKVTRIVSLSDDIAMALAAYRVRIVAPIPGKSAIGVEIPNKMREAVTLGDIIKSEDHAAAKGFLTVGLGKDIIGKPVMIDLKNQPHLLIAGATGSGKSVCVNSIITSLIYNYSPNYVRFILVDPKMVELQLYNGLPHLLTPVITDPHLAPIALKWAMNEMERRYRLLSRINTRDIDKYNTVVKREGGEHLPYIIVIIDELADLMMVASKDIESHITRIAQKARAVGIHLVIATQRPSVDIITGVIKANFPARIAFQVAQKTDSRTILDQNGAEKLLGKGDMLYQSPTRSFPIRIQGGFITEDEIMKIVVHCKKLGKPSYIDINQVFFENAENDEGEAGNDELFVEALKIVEESRKASASYLQRRLSIGYNRAARLIEQMEDLGYVGPQQGSKPREILI